MSLVIPDDFINVHFGYQAAGDPELAFTSLGFQLIEAMPTFLKVTVANTINEAWQTAFKNLTAIQWTMTGSRVTIGAATTPYLTFDVAGTQEGTGSSAPTPNNTAALFKKQTELAGRQGRGRMYVPGCDATSVQVNGVLDETERSNYEAALISFEGTIADDENIVAPILFHDEDSLVTTPTVIANIAVDVKVATQRRRMRP